MKETIKPEIDEENVNEYINGYLKSRNLKKEDLKRREHTKQKKDLIQQLNKFWEEATKWQLRDIMKPALDK